MLPGDVQPYPENAREWSSSKCVVTFLGEEAFGP
jgi:hypothetical protein